MTIISFWNNNTGKIGQTYSALAVATHMAIEHNYKILLMSTRYNDQVTLEAFGFNQSAQALSKLTQKRASMELESGIEGMTKLALSNRLTPEVVPNYTRMVFKDRLEILAAPKDRPGERVDYDRIYSATKNILTVARKYYDIVFVDLNNGLENQTTREILEMSNIIILNTEQKMAEFDKLSELKEKEKKLFTPKNTLTLINRYDRESKYTSKNITRYLNEKKEILTVPYDNLFAEAVQEGTAAEFFLNPRIRKMEDTEDKTAFLISELTRDAQAIVYRMQELQMRI